MNNNKKRNDNDSRKIFTMFILVAVLMVGTTSATYAYFALSATATNNITGVAASGNIAFSAGPTLLYPASSPYNTKPLVPQYAYNNSTNVLQLAINGSSSNKCVDANGNAICRVYTFTIKNNSTAVVNVTGKITFTNPTTNLKWAPMESATAISLSNATDTKIKAASTTATNMTGSDGTTSSFQLTANGGTKQFWIVIWINETGAVQTDSGTWYATLTFNETNGKGITSTIT